MSNITLYPTDTVYGLGVDATDPAAIRALKDLKGRSGDDAKKPISIVVTDMEMASKYAEVTPLARSLAERFLPGKLTVVLTAKNLPDELTAGTGTVGIRIPDHSVPLELVRRLGKPVTATSANVAGKPTLSTPEEILKQFGGNAGLIAEVIDGGPSTGTASTVVDARGDTPIVLREGAIPAAEL
jgi:L-threonylcarbamoyladenylate synthase